MNKHHHIEATLNGEAKLHGRYDDRNIADSDREHMTFLYPRNPFSGTLKLCVIACACESS